MFLHALLVATLLAADEPAVISTAVRDPFGVLVHTVRSPYQAGETQIKVLRPASFRFASKYRVVYLLPVEAQGDIRYGEGMLEAVAQDLQNKHQAIFVAPTFSHLPWYCDHPSDPAIRQESYFLKVVVPFIKQTYPVIETADGQLLCGFSKSGWGAWCLLLRHPELFGRAAACDSPMMMDRLGNYRTTPIFGTEENLRQYSVPRLLKANANALGPNERLILTGYGNFRQQHQQAHDLLRNLTIPHRYVDGPHRPHDWHSGWLPEAVELLLSPNNRSRSSP